MSNGNICLGTITNSNCDNELVVEVSGETPESGTITIKSRKIDSYEFTYASGFVVVNGSISADGVVTFAQFILKQAKDNNYYYETTPDFSMATADGEYGIYKALDDLGTSYYFRGDTEDNYVQFGGFYWRIVRINGDGTIRLIYSGAKQVHNMSDESEVIGYTIFDEDENVGYTYDDGTGTQVDSTIKKYIDNWYNDSLKENYDSYIADSIFCNDRKVGDEIFYDDEGNEVEKDAAVYVDTYYAAGVRLNNNNPQLTCTREEDKYTLNKSLGNGYLTTPVGLITLDELVMAGYNNDSEYFYLFNS